MVTNLTRWRHSCWSSRGTCIARPRTWTPDYGLDSDHDPTPGFNLGALEAAGTGSGETGAATDKPGPSVRVSPAPPCLIHAGIHRSAGASLCCGYMLKRTQGWRRVVSRQAPLMQFHAGR